MRNKAFSKFSLFFFGFFLFFMKLTSYEVNDSFFSTTQTEEFPSAEVWAEQFILQHGINSQGNFAGKLLPVSLPIDKSPYYSALQKKIAVLIPSEFQRPSLSLQVSGDEVIPFSQSSCAILGGMGPLSDARILDLVVTKLKQRNLLDRCKITLLSAPPPRGFFEILWNMQSYLVKLYAFLNGDHHHVYLASNVAHSHFNFMNMLGRKNMVNLTRYVADVAESCIAHPRVLIIGTKLGAKEQLYEKLLQDRNIEYVSLSEAQQQIVQEEIEKTKSGHLYDCGDRLYKAIHDVVIKQSTDGNPINVLLLGCTELPIALESKKSELQNLGVFIVDSEQLFAEKIAIDVEEYLTHILSLEKVS